MATVLLLLAAGTVQNGGPSAKNTLPRRAIGRGAEAASSK